jgi:hypothetical protein
MAQTGFTPISLYYTATAAATPTAGNLVAGELAINTADGKLFYKDSAGVVQTLATKDTAAGTFTSITDSGNLTFTGTGNRIRGDFSNATIASRVCFQTSTTNGASRLLAIPNGTGNTSAFAALNSSDPNNASWTQISTSDTLSSIQATISGTGTYLPMLFLTGGSERLRIDTSGNVGIGTSSPSASAKLTLNGSYTNSSLLVTDVNTGNVGLFGTVSALAGSGTNNDLAIASFSSQNTTFWTNSGERMRITSGGNLLVGTTSSSGRLTVRGTSSTSSDFALVAQNSSNATLLATRNDGAITTGTAAASPYNLTTGSAANMFVDSGGFLFRSTSSLKYKTDVKDATYGLSEVMQLRSVTYKSKNDNDKVFGGLIAEEVHEAGLTEFVQYAADGTPDALAYGNMVSLAFKAIQELKATVDAQAARIAALESK